MSNINNNRYRNILGAISIIKFGILLCITIISANELLKDNGVSSIITLDNKLIILIPLFLLIIFFLWTFSYVYMVKFKRIEIVQIIEDCFFIAMLTSLILLSNTYQSQYKYMFLFSIISSTISLGKKYGIINASISSSILLFIDLYFASDLPINVYFENDLMLSFGFILVAWVLGEYKKFESDQREMLEAELIEQLKQQDLIEEMLLKNQDSYNLLIKHSYYSIIVHDNEKILYINDNALRFFGVESHEIANSGSIFNIYNSEDETSLKAKYLDIIENKKSNVSFEEKIVDRNGKSINIHNISTYCMYGKRPVILTIMRDVTSEKQVQVLKKEAKENIKLLTQTQEQNKFITEFFSNISHELKTPINVIFSSLQLLNIEDEEEFNRNRKRYLNIMKQNCYRLIRLVNNLLDSIKYDSGFITPNMKNENIVDMVETIIMSIVPYAENNGIELIFDTNTEEKIIAVDGDKIERIILNLVSNALKFTDKNGSIYVTITDKEDNVEISVKDTGIGIPEDKIDFIFGRFSQVDKNIKRNHEGTGIGLSLVKSFVELHDGKVVVKSKVGEGSEFIAILPANLVETGVIETEIKDNIVERVNLELSDLYSDNI